MATGTLTEEVAVAASRIDGKVVGSVLVGMGVGVAVGFYIGYRYSKKKLRAEIFEEAEKEMEDIREHYRKKTMSAEAQAKPSMDEIIEKRGYAVIEEEEPGEGVRLLRPPGPVSPARPARRRGIQLHVDPNARVFRSQTAEKDKDEEWDYAAEEANRTDTAPYIIHQDEYTTNESGNSQTSYIYYALDDVLIEEDDPQTILMNRENLIGEEALNRFGHGADDYNLVHVRNPYLELDIVINRIRASWEEEVAGLDTHEPS